MNFRLQSILFVVSLSVMASNNVFFGSGLNLSLSDEETSGNLWSTTLHDETFAPGEFNVDDRFVSVFILFSHGCCELSFNTCGEGIVQFF